MALFHLKLHERYEYYQFQQKQTGLPQKSFIVRMFELLIQEVETYPHKQRSIRETFYIMPYCKLMKVITTREEWDLWKYELKYLYQYLEPKQI